MIYVRPEVTHPEYLSDLWEPVEDPLHAAKKFLEDEGQILVQQGDGVSLTLLEGMTQFLAEAKHHPVLVFLSPHGKFLLRAAGELLLIDGMNATVLSKCITGEKPKFAERMDMTTRLRALRE